MFLATAGEEFGYTNAYYDWLTGAWWAATRAHPEWAGRVHAMINIEGMAIKDAPLTLRSNPELQPWLEGLASRHQALAPYGSEAITPVSSWNDQWTFTAAGIPSVKVSTPSDEYDTSYHSDFETAELVDWPYQATIAKFVFRVVTGLDDSLLPYRLEARADDLVATVSKDELLEAGADAAIVARLVAAVEAFRAAAAAFDSRAEATPPSAIDSANGGLLEIERAVNSGFTALSPAEDDATVYPHQAVLEDAQGIDAALAARRAAGPDPAAALKALEGTYLTRLGIVFSFPVYLKYLARLDPGFELITWGAQGQLPEPLDVIPEYRAIQSGDVAGAIGGLESKRGELTAELNRRLAGMASLLEQVTPRIEVLPGRR